MGSPMSKNLNVRQVIDAVENKDLDWLNSLYDKKIPNPAHLMYAASVIVGEGGYENIGQLMSKTEARNRRSKLIDLCIQFASSQEETLKPEVPESSETSEVVEEPKKPRRKRRTKAQIEADKAAKVAPKDPDEGLGEVLSMLKEISKTIYNLEERIEKIEEKLLDSFHESKKANAQLVTTSTMLTAIKEGLIAGELDLIINQKLSTPAIGDTIAETWPKDEDDKVPF